MAKFDLHVATQTDFPVELESELTSLGLRHDNLVDRHVAFYGGVQLSACPLIGLHMTKKYDSLTLSVAREQIWQDLHRVERLLKDGNVVGYAHGEVTNDWCDTTIEGRGLCEESPPWPVKRFVPLMSPNDKKWDIHIAIPIDLLSQTIRHVLESSGMYSIDLIKHRNGRERVFRVYTIQGTSNPLQGTQLYTVLCEWFRKANASYIEIKQEAYIGMIKVGNPLIVPPTISHFEMVDTGVNPTVCQVVEQPRGLYIRMG